VTAAALPRITVVGLGPGDERWVTQQVRDAIASTPVRHVRTARHPSAVVVGDAVSFDDVYERADTFDDVYATIVDLLVSSAAEHGHVLYAVPGSPLVLERTVRRLRADERVRCDVLPAISFLDVAYERLGIDPVETGLKLVDGHEFATAAAGYDGPMLIAHTHANWVLSDIKLAAEHATGDEPVVILQRLGTDDEAVVHTTWADLDRTVDADHLTCVYVPGLGAPVGAELVRFHQLARVLREQCPWDQEQTHRSLVKYLLEETYEVVDAIEALDPDDPSTDDALVEELGDLLYQIEFHATIAEQEGRFTIADVAQQVHDKLVRRHPHVFPPEGGDTVRSAVPTRWSPTGMRSSGSRSSAPASSRASPRANRRSGTRTPCNARPPRSASTGPTCTARCRRSPRRPPRCSSRPRGGDERTPPTRSATCCSPSSTSPATSASSPRPRCAPPREVPRRFEGVELLARARDVDLHAADLATLDALWDEVKLAER
jgi:tetrapyrrole methylase family protein/MazG family protein